MEIEAEGTRYLEDYLKCTGWGLYGKFMIVFSCIIHFTQAVTFATMVFAVAVSSCDLVYIPEMNALRIFTCYLIGCGFGGLIGSLLSDRYGRKRYLTYSLMCIFFSSFTAAFAYNIYVVIGATLILGVGLEICATQIKLLVIEIISKEKRGHYILFCNMFWTLGKSLLLLIIIVIAIILPAILVFVILFETPALLNAEKSANVQLTTWRIMFAVSGGIHLIIACICAIIEESPRYYLYMGRNYLAYLLLKQLYAINKSRFAENFKVREEDLKHLIRPYDLSYAEPEQYWEIFKKFLWRFWHSLKLLFSKRFCQVTEVLMLLKMPLIILGIFQLNISLAKQLTSNRSNYASEKFRSLDFIYPVLQPISYMPKKIINSSNICQINENNHMFFKHYLLLGIAIIPGEILCILLIDRVGRKPIMFSGFILASCAYLTISFISQHEIQLAAACVILSSIGGCISTLTLINLELYPTAIRATSNAVTSFPGYLLAVFVLNFIMIERQILTVILGILYFCLTIFICFLPEMKGKPLVE